MARQKIREYDAKRILAAHLEHYSAGKINISFQSILIGPHTNLEDLPTIHPWILEQKLAIKPDQLFGRRGKLGLVLLNASFEEVKAYLTTNRNKQITIGKATDTLTHFLIEPYVPHEQEYYLAIISEREYNTIYFSKTGGISMEEQWDKVATLKIGTLESLSEEKVVQAFNISEEKMKAFIQSIYPLFCDLDFTYLEFNPFTTINENIRILDTVALVDDYALLKNKENWGLGKFPRPFGKKMSPEEEFIAALDHNSGASLKLTILNPRGRIWNIFSGGGASVILLDTLADLGVGTEIANYGEYSGNPTEEEAYDYAKTILGLMTREKHKQGKVLLIGGAIANFTDVEKTFRGVAKALSEYGGKMQEHQVSIYIRRGGPNYETGLAFIKEIAAKIGLPAFIFGPETALTHITTLAAAKIAGKES